MTTTMIIVVVVNGDGDDVDGDGDRDGDGGGGGGSNGGQTCCDFLQLLARGHPKTWRNSHSACCLWPNAMCFHSISGEGRQQPHESHMVCNAEGREPHKYDTMMIMMLLMLPMLMIVTMITIVILIV